MRLFHDILVKMKDLKTRSTYQYITMYCLFRPSPPLPLWPSPPPLPDGRIQTVTYNANDITGNVAEVTYSGEPVYPPAPAGGYVAAAPVHAVHAVAHPVVHHAPVLAHAVHAAPVHAVHHGLAHGVVAHGGLVHHG